MGVRKKTRIVTAGAVVLLYVCIFANATILQVSDIQIACPGTFYKYTSGSGGLTMNLSCTGLLKLEGDTTYNYSLSSAKIIISSALVTDTSSGGYASGLFQGGQTITITGTITDKTTSTVVYTGTILVATMDISSSQTWSLVESASTAINGGVDFNPSTTVGLGSGITYGSDVLKIGAFSSYFSFKSLMTDPTKFAATQTLMGTSSTVQLTAIPEPASILMFVSALLALRIKRK